jgi:membrane protease subunit HflC
MKDPKKLIIGAVILVVVLIVGFSSLFIVEEGEYKVVFQFGEAVQVYETPGIKAKIPFIQNVSSLPKKRMVADSPSTPILTLDKKPIEVDNYTVWRIKDPNAFLPTIQSVANAQQIIGNSVYNTVRRKLSEINYDNIIGDTGTRGNLNDEITADIANNIEGNGYGIEIIDVRIKRTDLPEENKQSVYNRMISDRQSIATLYLSEGDEESRKVTADADRQAEVLIAQAESEAKKIIAEGEQIAAQTYNKAYGADPEFYSLYRTLDSYLTSFKGEPVIMLPIDSPYTQILLGRQ